LFAENWRKSQKIVIITSTPGANPTTVSYNASAVKDFTTLASSLERLESKSSFFCLEKNALAYYNAGIVGT
jgi:hypothetical protein